MKMHSGSLNPNNGLNTIEFKVVNGLLDPKLRMIHFKPREIKLGKLAGMAAPRTPDDMTHNDLLGVVVVGVVVVGVEEDMATDEGKEDGKETYPCREVELEW
jgi:hypothetical protein